MIWLFPVIAAQSIVKRVLPNGLTTLLLEKPHTETVAVQLYYHVGSKDEDSYEKGIAHLLEHMVFKGTNILSESDIFAITNKLAGYCNAFTTYDHTSYVFHLPKRSWHHALPILANCMTECTFKQDLLNAEFKAVVQELKMNRDNYPKQLIEELLNSMFPDHPYHYPVIGFKRDIWNTNSENLHAFYKKHYCPNNAVLIIVGDIAIEDAYRQAVTAFQSIPAQPAYTKKTLHHRTDLMNKNTILYRDIQQPQALFVWKMPGLKTKRHAALSTLSMVLAGDQSSRLYKKVVEEKKYAHSISSFLWELEEYSLLMIHTVPKSTDSVAQIKDLIVDEMMLLQEHSLTAHEVKKVLNGIRSDFIDLHEQPMALASHIGRFFLATRDEHFSLNPFSCSEQELCQEVTSIIRDYGRPSQLHCGLILPLAATDRDYWHDLQTREEQEDAALLEHRIRTSDVEEPSYANTIQPAPYAIPSCVQPEEYTLANGLQVVVYHNPTALKTTLYLKLKATNRCMSLADFRAYTMLSSVLQRETKRYSFEAITDLLAEKAITFSFTESALAASFFPEDFPVTLDLITSILTEPTFNEHHIELVKEQTISGIRHLYESADTITSYYLKQKMLGRKIETCDELINSIQEINKSKLQEMHAQYITPDKAYIIIVGNSAGHKIPELLAATLGTWNGPRIEVPEREPVNPPQQEYIHYPLARDQVSLAFGAPSVTHQDDDYYPLCIASIILGESPASRLFQLREQTGLFYTARGSFVAHAGKKNGYFYIQVLLSPDYVHLTKNLLLQLVTTFADSLTQEEVEQAKNMLLTRCERAFSTNQALVNYLAFNKKYNLGWNSLGERIKKIEQIQINDVKNAIKRILKEESLVFVTTGRKGLS